MESFQLSAERRHATDETGLVGAERQGRRLRDGPTGIVLVPHARRHRGENVVHGRQGRFQSHRISTAGAREADGAATTATIGPTRDCVDVILLHHRPITARGYDGTLSIRF